MVEEMFAETEVPDDLVGAAAPAGQPADHPQDQDQGQRYESGGQAVATQRRDHHPEADDGAVSMSSIVPLPVSSAIRRMVRKGTVSSSRVTIGPMTMRPSGEISPVCTPKLTLT